VLGPIAIGLNQFFGRGIAPVAMAANCDLFADRAGWPSTTFTGMLGDPVGGLPLHPFTHRLRGWLVGQIETLYPGSFAVVMATGIISNTLFLEGHRALSDALFAANLIAYSWLVVFSILRAFWFWQALWVDLINPRLVFSFFTIVAGTDVFGVGLYLRGFESVAQALWLFALISWCALIYLGFGVLTFRNTGDGADVVDGAWLMAIVGTQSLVILGTTIIPALGALGDPVFVLIHSLWGLGLCLYESSSHSLLIACSFSTLHRTISRYRSGWSWAQPRSAPMRARSWS
jgi:hypothetical protein